jgi:predicted Fe-S protein YdhL (DUF1289 family)
MNPVPPATAPSSRSSGANVRASPCNGVCEIDPAGGLCRGCLRTIDEIVAWGGASEEDRRLVWQRIGLREQALFDAPPETAK